MSDPGRDISDQDWRNLVSSLSNLQYRGVFYENCNILVVKGTKIPKFAAKIRKA